MESKAKGWGSAMVPPFSGNTAYAELKLNYTIINLNLWNFNCKNNYKYHNSLKDFSYIFV